MCSIRYSFHVNKRVSDITFFIAIMVAKLKDCFSPKTNKLPFSAIYLSIRLSRSHLTVRRFLPIETLRLIPWLGSSPSLRYSSHTISSTPTAVFGGDIVTLFSLKRGSASWSRLTQSSPPRSRAPSVAIMSKSRTLKRRHEKLVGEMEGYLHEDEGEEGRRLFFHHERHT